MKTRTRNQYLRLKEEIQAEVNAFPLMFAFDKKQFAEGMKGLGLEPEDTDKILSIGFGGYMRKSDREKFTEMTRRHNRMMNDAIEADKDGTGFCVDMFEYELANHEYCITYDETDTFDALGLTFEDVSSSPKLLNALKLAKERYWAGVQL